MSRGPVELQPNGEVDLCSLERRLALILSSETKEVSAIYEEGRTLVVKWWLGQPSLLVECLIQFEFPIPQDGRTLCITLWKETDLLISQVESWQVKDVFLHLSRRPKQYTLVYERRPLRHIDYYSSDTGQ